MGGSEWSNKPRFIEEDENCDTKNETKQTSKGQTSTSLEVVYIREQTPILSESVKMGKGRLPNVG